MSTIPSHPNNIGTVTIKLSLSIFEQIKISIKGTFTEILFLGHRVTPVTWVTLCFFGNFCFWVTGSRWSRGSRCVFLVNFISGSQGHAGHVGHVVFFLKIVSGSQGHAGHVGHVVFLGKKIVSGSQGHVDHAVCFW